MLPASGHFLYSQPGHADLQGSVWDPSAAEGTQNFNEDDFHYPYGQITPRSQGQDQTETVDDISSKWISQEHASAVAEPMRRISSRSSCGSHKNRTIKAPSRRSRPRIVSTISQSSQMSNYDMTGNAQMDAFLLPESDTHSVSSQMLYNQLPMSAGFSDGLPYSPAVLASGMAQQSIDPSHMQLNFEASLAGNSPAGSWESLSQGGSRNSSPGIPEDASQWSMPVGGSPTHTDNSSPVMNGMSPRYV